LKKNNLFFVGILLATDEKARSQNPDLDPNPDRNSVVRIRGDPDPYQNVTDPQHCQFLLSLSRRCLVQETGQIPDIW
jgi:hypothetical protein